MYQSDSHDWRGYEAPFVGNCIGLSYDDADRRQQYERGHYVASDGQYGVGSYASSMEAGSSDWAYSSNPTLVNSASTSASVGGYPNYESHRSLSASLDIGTTSQGLSRGSTDSSSSYLTSGPMQSVHYSMQSPAAWLSVSDASVHRHVQQSSTTTLTSSSFERDSSENKTRHNARDEEKEAEQPELLGLMKRLLGKEDPTTPRRADATFSDSAGLQSYAENVLAFHLRRASEELLHHQVVPHEDAGLSDSHDGANYLLHQAPHPHQNATEHQANVLESSAGFSYSGAKRSHCSESWRISQMIEECTRPLPQAFLTPAELAMSPETIIETLPCNTTDGPYCSELLYLYTHYMLLRYDTFSDLHEKVHVLRTAFQRTRRSIPKDLQAETATVTKLKPAALLKMAKAYFFGVQVVGIVFERPPPPERQFRNQKQQQQRSPPALLVEWDLAQTAQQRRLICETGSKPPTRGAQARALTEHQIERMDMVVVTTADDNFSTIAHYATVVEVMDQFGQSVLKQVPTGPTDGYARQFSWDGRAGGSWEQPRPCRLLLEFVPMSSMATVCQLVSDCSQLVVVHFPVLLLSVLPMLDNIARLHAQLLKSEIRKSGGEVDIGKGRKHWETSSQEEELHDLRLHYSNLLVDLNIRHARTYNNADLKLCDSNYGKGDTDRSSIFADLTDAEVEAFIQKNEVDPSQARAIRMCCGQKFSLIQGPPGTGKTHVARLVVKLVCERLKSKWKEAAQQDFSSSELDYANRTSSPQSIRILVMSLKNLSLDNICRGCIPFLPKGRSDILRLGGKSQEDGAFTTQHEARQMYGHLPEFGCFGVGDSIASMGRAQSQLDTLFDAIHAATALQKDGVALGWQAFLEGASPAQCRSLKAGGYSRDFKSVVYDEWLCADEAETVEGNLAAGANLSEILEDVLKGTGLSSNDACARVVDPNWDLEQDEEDDGEVEEFDEKDERAQMRRELLGRMQQRGLVRAAPQGAIIKLGASLSRDCSGRDAELLGATDLFELEVRDRHRLAALWQRRYLDSMLDRLVEALAKYEIAQKEMLSNLAERTAWLASKFMVTALTVTRSAMDRELLAYIRPHIIIVEEAAEILEASMLGGLFIGNAPEPHPGKGAKRSKGGKRGKAEKSVTTDPHVILIGDHKQLQPPVSTEALELQLGLGLSLFERLASNGMMVATLQHQRRMHPILTPLHRWLYASEGVHISDCVADSRSISTVGGFRHSGLPGVNLVPCDDIWERERDAWLAQIGECSDGWNRRSRWRKLPSEQEPLQSFPSRLSSACDSRCLFLAHNSEEDSEGLSPKNEQEAKIVCALVHFLVHVAGVKTQSVTVLTPYKGQLHVLRNMIKALQLRDADAGHSESSTEQSRFRGIDVQTVDTFQGEENDIIIFSLTRGRRLTRFLQTQNRLCVSVSRARCACIFVGNPALLVELPDWQEVLQHMSVASCSGEAAEINTCLQPVVARIERPASVLFCVCPQHPTGTDRDSCMTMATYVEQLYPESEKTKWCTTGWQGARSSAYRNETSVFFQCRQKCGFWCTTHGGCDKLCHDHGACQKLVDVVLPCGHEQRLPCHVDVQTAQCSQWVEVKRPSCGHHVRVRCCTDPELQRCSSLVSVCRPGCKHSIILECSVAYELGFREVEVTTLAVNDVEEVNDEDVVRSVPLPDCQHVVGIRRPGCGHPTYVRCGDARHLRAKGHRDMMIINDRTNRETHLPEDIPLGPCPWVLCVARPHCGHEIKITCHLWDCLAADTSLENRRLWKRVVPRLACLVGDENSWDVFSTLPLPPCKEQCRKKCFRAAHECKAICHAGLPCLPCDVEIQHVCKRCGLAGSEDIRCADADSAKCHAKRELVHPYCKGTPQHFVRVPCYYSENPTLFQLCGPCRAPTIFGFPCGHSKEFTCEQVHGEFTLVCEAVIREPNPWCSRGHYRERQCQGEFEDLDEEPIPCCELVDFEFACGHPPARVECHVAEKAVQCNVLVDVRHPLCSRGHTLSVCCADQTRDPRLSQPCSVSHAMLLPCGHTKTITCGQHQDGEKIICDEGVDVELPCGHYMQIACNRTDSVEIEDLMKECIAELMLCLPCGHDAAVSCNQNSDASLEQLAGNCMENVSLTLGCGHAVKVPCHRAKDKYQETYEELCNALVEMHLDCGHTVHVTCNQTREGSIAQYLQNCYDHCSELVDESLDCGHSAKIPCHIARAMPVDQSLRNMTEDSSILEWFEGENDGAEASEEETCDDYTKALVKNLKDELRKETIGREINLSASASARRKRQTVLEVHPDCPADTTDFFPTLPSSDIDSAGSMQFGSSSSSACKFKCMTPVRRRRNCGHVGSFPCHVWADSERLQLDCLPVCEEEVHRELRCGHIVASKCYEQDETDLLQRKCNSLVQKVLPCGHQAELPCHAWENQQSISQYQCQAIVNSKFECGHTVSHPCCKRIGKSCNVVVNKILSCGHTKAMPCGTSPSSLLCDDFKVVHLPHCGHDVKIPCGADPISARCRQVVVAIRPECGHAEMVECGLLHSSGTSLGLLPWSGDPASEPSVRESCRDFPIIDSMPIPVCRHMGIGPHPICRCDVWAPCDFIRNPRGLSIGQLALCSSCEKCSGHMLSILSGHVRARSMPPDCTLLDCAPTRKKVTEAFIERLNSGLESWCQCDPVALKAAGGLFQNRSTDGDVIAVEEAMSNRGGRGRVRIGLHLKRQFLEHRLSLPSEFMRLSPLPFLAPVPSANYLRQLLQHGFPEAREHEGEDNRFQGQQVAAVVSLSLSHPQAFVQHVRGRRLVVLGLWLPSVPVFETTPAHLANHVQEEIQCALGYLQGVRCLEVASPRQLLPLYIFEI